MSELPIVLLAHGRQERLPGLSGPKHFLRVGGEPVVVRTVRLLEEHGLKPFMVVAPKLPEWAEFAANRDVRWTSFEGAAPSIVSAVAGLLQHDVAQGALFLLADVVFSRRAIDFILQNQSGMAFYGKSGPNPWTGKSHNEIYAFRCRAENRVFVFKSLIRQDPSIPWNLHRLSEDLRLPYVEIADWTDDIDDERDLAVGLPALDRAVREEPR